MASVVAMNILRENLSLTSTYQFKDNLSMTWRARFDQEVFLPVEAFNTVEDATGTRFTENSIIGNLNILLPPFLGESYGLTAPHIFVKSKKFTPADSADLRIWDMVVTWGVSEDGEEDQQENYDDPLNKAPIFNIEYIESEVPIKNAKNKQALLHGNGDGESRAVDTPGAVVNAAGVSPDVPPFATVRNPVLTIEKNYADLNAIVQLNENFQLTTNDAPAFGFAKETLEYHVTDSTGIQKAGDISYYPGITRIEKKKTTLLIIDNMGYHFYDPEHVPDPENPLDTGGIVHDKGAGEPFSLQLDGTRGENSVIEYENLTPADYSVFET